MSDAAATPTPVAAVADSAAPVDAAKTPEVGGTETPVDPFAAFDEMLKRTPAKYKAGGKEKTVASFKELLRKAEQADGIQTRAQELADREAKASAVLERDAKLKSAKTPKERVAILREFAGEAFDEAAEEAILERIEREKAMSGMTPAERKAREEAESYRARLEAFEAKEAAAKEAEEQARYDAEESALMDSLAGQAVKALTAAGLPKEAAPDAGRRLAFLMSRAEKLGLPLDADELAGKAVEMAGRDFGLYTAKMEGDGLLRFVGEATAKRISRAYLAKMGVGASQSQATQPAPKQAEPPSRESPVTQWKKFGI